MEGYSHVNSVKPCIADHVVPEIYAVDVCLYDFIRADKLRHGNIH